MKAEIQLDMEVSAWELKEDHMEVWAREPKEVYMEVSAWASTESHWRLST